MKMFYSALKKSLSCNSWHLEIQLLIKTLYLLIFLNFSITLLIYVELFMLIVIVIASFLNNEYFVYLQYLYFKSFSSS